MSSRGAALLGLLLCAAVSIAARAQTPTSIVRGPAAERRSVVDRVATVVRRQYVSADTGILIAERLLARSRAGAYDSLPDLPSFTRAVTIDLRAVNGDKHLSLSVVPGKSDPARSKPSSSTPSDFGFARVEMMDGNVGYLRVSSFASPTPAALSSLASAMNTLRDADALVVDVRDNPGGDGGMNDYLWGYFAGHDSVKTMHMLPRGATSPTLRWTKPIDNPRPRAGIPVFILTSSRTGSAAEGFAFFLQQSGRARTVGETSAGAGHNVAFFDVGPDLAVGVSVGRVRYSGNGREWERTGVHADIPAPADSALVVALRAAKQRP